MGTKSSFLDKVLGRISRLDAEGVQTVVQRLARERSFLETLFNTIEDGVLVVDEAGRILYFNQAVTQYLGLQPNVEGQPITNFIHEIGNPLNSLHIHLQLIERELKKLKEPPESGRSRLRASAESQSRQNETGDIVRKLEQYLGVAKGEIDRLDNIVTQFLHAIRPS